MPITDGDKMAAAIMAAATCGKIQATPVEYIQTYFEMLEKMLEHDAKQKRKAAPPVRRKL
jgi:hypothetical protein